LNDWDANTVNGDYYRDPSADTAKHGGVPVYRRVKSGSDPVEFDVEKPVYLFYYAPKKGESENHRGWWMSKDPDDQEYFLRKNVPIPRLIHYKLRGQRKGTVDVAPPEDGWITFNHDTGLKEPSPAICTCTKQDPSLRDLNGEWEYRDHAGVVVNKFNVQKDFVECNSRKDDKLRMDERGRVFWATAMSGVWYLERKDTRGDQLVGLTWHFRGDATHVEIRDWTRPRAESDFPSLSLGERFPIAIEPAPPAMAESAVPAAVPAIEDHTPTAPSTAVGRPPPPKKRQKSWELPLESATSLLQEQTEFAKNRGPQPDAIAPSRVHFEDLEEIGLRDIPFSSSRRYEYWDDHMRKEQTAGCYRLFPESDPWPIHSIPQIMRQTFDPRVPPELAVRSYGSRIFGQLHRDHEYASKWTATRIDKIGAQTFKEEFGIELPQAVQFNVERDETLVFRDVQLPVDIDVALSALVQMWGTYPKLNGGIADKVRGDNIHGWNDHGLNGVGGVPAFQRLRI
jgi:hypothetical protein